MIYLELLLGFLKVGCFAFGGYGAIPLIRETVLRYGWMDEAHFAELVALSESTPGPIMVNMATYIGSTRGGVAGAALATAAVVLPAFVIVLLLLGALKKLLRYKGFQAAADAVNPCTVGIILATGFFMALKNIFPSGAGAIDIKALILFAVLAALYFGAKKLFKHGLHPILFIVISGIAGAVITLR